MKRSILLAFVLMLALTAPASAHYLHVASILPRAERMARADGRYLEATHFKFGHCWHNNGRVIECSYALEGVWACTVKRDDSVVCPDGLYDADAKPPTTYWQLIAAEHHGHVELHLVVGKYP